MHKSFLESNKRLQCLFTTFFRYKPFYVTPLTEREKELCIYMNIQNVHLLLKRINKYCHMKKLTIHYSVKELLKSDPKNDTDTFSEINYYPFEREVES